MSRRRKALAAAMRGNRTKWPIQLGNLVWLILLNGSKVSKRVLAEIKRSRARMTEVT
jgi:hypothetical protein